MKFLIVFAIILIGVPTFAQDDFQLKYNDEDRVEYQGVIKHPGKTKNELFKLAELWCENTDRRQKVEFKDEEMGKLIAKSEFATIGKSNYFSNKEYHYVFTCDVVLEFKDGKTRYTLEKFKKKTSPDEPGSTIEYFIENYTPKIKSDKKRAQYAKMLDEIELAIQDQVWDLIDELKKTFGPAGEEEDEDEDDW